MMQVESGHQFKLGHLPPSLFSATHLPPPYMSHLQNLFTAREGFDNLKKLTETTWFPLFQKGKKI